MKPRRPLATLWVSLALHGGVLGTALLLASRASDLGALFIDLTEWAEARMGAGAVAAQPGAAPRAPAGAPARSTPARETHPSPRQPGPPPTTATPERAAPSEPSAAVPVAPARLPSPAAEPPDAGRGDAAVAASAPAAAHAGAPSLGASGRGPAPAGGGVVSGAPGRSGGADGHGARGGPGASGAGVGDAPDVGRGVALAAAGPSTRTAGPEDEPYLRRLRQRIQDSLRYPLVARRRDLTGTVNLELLIRPDGTFGVVAVVDSSSHAILDDAAVETVRSLDPEPLPSEVPPRALRVELPVVFALDEWR